MLKELTPLKAIRKKCLDCMCGQANEVKLCPMTDCTLFAYRFGHRPKEKPMYEAKEYSMTDEQREENVARLRRNAEKGHCGDSDGKED